MVEVESIAVTATLDASASRLAPGSLENRG